MTSSPPSPVPADRPVRRLLAIGPDAARPAPARATTPLAAPGLWADIERAAAGGGER